MAYVYRFYCRPAAGARTVAYAAWLASDAEASETAHRMLAACEPGGLVRVYREDAEGAPGEPLQWLTP